MGIFNPETSGQAGSELVKHMDPYSKLFLPQFCFLFSHPDAAVRLGVCTADVSRQLCLLHSQVNCIVTA